MMLSLSKRLLRDTRGGATAIAAVAVTVITVAGAAFITDHNWLVDQRDTYKAAADAAGVAATLELNRQLDADPTMTDAALSAILKPIATRYVVLNLQHMPSERLQLAMETLVVDITPDRSRRMVDVAVQADSGDFLLAGQLRLLAGASGPEGGIRVVAAADTVTSPVEVVLAIDISDSMDSTLSGEFTRAEDSRMDIVKRAARSLVDILEPNAEGRVAIGVVPWNQVVRLAPGAAGTWASATWARYPARRTYGVPYRCQPNGSCTAPAEVNEAVAAAAADDAWTGCLDGHRMGAGTHASVPPSSEFFSLPSTNPFAQGYFVPTYGVSYACLDDPLPGDFRTQICYSGDPSSSPPYKVGSQYFCGNYFPTILSLSTDHASIDAAIDALTPRLAGYTYSALGVLWGQRLLEHRWTSVWGGTNHPVDPALSINEGLRKAIVLLTDGEDTHCGPGNHDCSDSSIGVDRSDACDEAKDRGTEIFVVAAMHPDNLGSDFEISLKDCSSESPDSDNTYAYLNNSTQAALETAFADIANQLRTVRRID